MNLQKILLMAIIIAAIFLGKAGADTPLLPGFSYNECCGCQEGAVRCNSNILEKCDAVADVCGHPDSALNKANRFVKASDCTALGKDWHCTKMSKSPFLESPQIGCAGPEWSCTSSNGITTTTNIPFGGGLTFTKKDECYDPRTIVRYGCSADGNIEPAFESCVGPWTIWGQHGICTDETNEFCDTPPCCNPDDTSLCIPGYDQYCEADVSFIGQSLFECQNGGYERIGSCFSSNGFHPSSCTDTDNGSYEIKGTVTGFTIHGWYGSSPGPGIPWRLTDYCIDNKTLIEYNCEGKDYLKTEYDCSADKKACSNGVCTEPSGCNPETSPETALIYNPQASGPGFGNCTGQGKAVFDSEIACIPFFESPRYSTIGSMIIWPAIPIALTAMPETRFEYYCETNYRPEEKQLWVKDNWNILPCNGTGTNFFNPPYANGNACATYELLQSCKDHDACTIDSCNAAGCTPNSKNMLSCDWESACAHTKITACISSDGCCPAGCTSQNDNDCKNCGSNSQCSDNDACTTDTCDAGTCRNTQKTCGTPGTCQELPGTCDTTTGNCSYLPKTCDNPGQCENPAGTCNAQGNCEYAQIQNCCSSNSECNDNKPCTTDKCETDGTCSHTQKTCNTPGNCEINPGTCSTTSGNCEYPADPGGCSGPGSAKFSIVDIKYEFPAVVLAGRESGKAMEPTGFAIAVGQTRMNVEEENRINVIVKNNGNSAGDARAEMQCTAQNAAMPAINPVTKTLNAEETRAFQMDIPKNSFPPGYLYQCIFTIKNGSKTDDQAQRGISTYAIRQSAIPETNPFLIILIGLAVVIFAKT
ncbi:MAG: hypothetical protein PHH08_00190, partial [Candidatus ainarchaeum sp.]|nr:hypothetical protein [Candidatus ainarchaeum sp.]